MPVARFTFGDARLANVPRQDRSIEGPMTTNHVGFVTFAGMELTIQGGICRSPGPEAKFAGEALGQILAKNCTATLF